MQDLIKAYKEKEKELKDLHKELCKYDDGFLYITRVSVYGSIIHDTHTNEFSVQEVCNKFNGDNGMCSVYTNNPLHTINNWEGGGVSVVSDEELKKITPKNKYN